MRGEERNRTPPPIKSINDADYQVPFEFTGKLDRITLTIDRPKLTPEDEKRLMQESQRNNRASE